ncbi:MAG: TRAP transporter large permease [Rhodospirillales bacterium]|nr:TRAP transporter large permease [Rhodospirillales bacterium]
MLITLLIFFAAAFIGVPVAFALGFAGTLYLVVTGQASVNVVATILFGAMDSFSLLAIPLFILAGDLMLRCGMMSRIVDFAKAVMGPMLGGLAQVNIGASMVFGGISGVSLADAAAIGKTLIPSMIKEGYPRGLAAAITTSSCVMGAIIPPSVGMIIIAYIYGGSLSIGRLFLSGAIPGLLIGFTQMIVVALIAKRRNLPRSAKSWSLREIFREFRRSILALGMPVIIIGGIITGFFTPTEAGAAAVAYALVVGSIGGLHLSLRDIADSLLTSAKLSGIVFIMLATAKLFAWLLVINMVPQSLGEAIKTFVGSPQMFMVTVLVVFLVLGFVIDGIASMIMVVPVVAPMASIFNVEPHHLALVILMSTQFALLTPPVALGLFLVCPIAGCTISEAIREMLPFTACILLITLLVIYMPAVSQWLPHLVGY